MNLSDRLLGNDVKIHAYSGVTAGTSILMLNDIASLVNPPSVVMGAVNGAGVALDFASSSASDTLVGTGAQKITVAGLGPGGAPQVKTYSTNGTAVVTTGDLWTRVFAAWVSQVGGGGFQAGDIYIVKTGTGAFVAGVPGTLTSAVLKIVFAGGVIGSGYSGYFTVPVSYAAGAGGQAYSRKAKIQGVTLGVAAQNDRFLIQAQPNLDADPNLATVWDIVMSGTAGGPGWVDLARHIEDFGPGTDIIMRHIPLAAGAIASCAMDIKMV